MPDVFPDLPDHPDYLPVIGEVSQHLGVQPSLAIYKPVRIMGARLARQAWTWFWREHLEGDDEDRSIKRRASLKIDIHDPWHGAPWHNYEVDIYALDGLYLTVKARDRPPITPTELRRALEMCDMLPPPLHWMPATEDDAGVNW